MQIGAHPFIYVVSDTHYVDILTRVPEEYIGNCLTNMHTLIRESQAIISIGLWRKDPFLETSVDNRKLAILLQESQRVAETIYDGKRRWLGTEFPTREQAQFLGVDFTTYHDLFWKSLDVDYAGVGEKALKIMNKIKGARDIAVTCPKGTKISFSANNRPIVIEDGISDINKRKISVNLPAGEVFLAPVEESVNGVAIIETTFNKGMKISNLRLEFKKGRLVRVQAAKGMKAFDMAMESAHGDKDVIGEFGIGINPNVTELIGHPLIDEKVAGTVHIALGENRDFGGQNSSDLHWDMVIKNPTVKIDGDFLIRNGHFAI
jgi:aminopeptidase